MPKPLKVTNVTPIEEIQKIGGKTRLFIKRDDLNGLLTSGNKARKLEYLVADALSKKCDTIITCGPVQSNHCRTTAAFAQMFKLDCHLFLRRKDNEETTGNLLLDQLMGAKIQYITPAQYERRMELMAAYARTLKGRRPYIIPEGGSNEVGSLGYIDGMKEMAGFIKKNNIEAIYCAVGSGGTYAGLLLGKKLLRLKIDLNGIIICDTVKYFEDKVMEICVKAVAKYSLKTRVKRSDLHLIGGFVGEGYGIPYTAELKIIKDMAKYGIILEPVYTGKAFYGMLKNLQRKKYKKVLFVHTGGIFSIFAYSRELMRVIN